LSHFEAAGFAARVASARQSRAVVESGFDDEHFAGSVALPRCSPTVAERTDLSTNTN